MNQPIKIEKIDVVGFRAYLQAQTVPLFRGSTPLSLAVFAPNAAGKSSLVDAFEFYFSEDSTLRRLGKRTFQSNAGPIAMEHVRADSEGLTPSVHIWFRQGNDKFDDSRLMSDGQPIAAKRVLSGTRLPFVIRGYELRGFVEETTPGDRYKELAAWFSLEPLSLIQKNLKALRSRVKQSLESNSEIKERSRDIARATADNITSWDDSALCSWLNVEVLAPLDSTISLRHISELDPGFQELTRRKDVELDSIGIGQLKRLSNRLEPLIAQSDGGTAGMILAFEAATQSLQEASDREEEERSKASNAIFNQVWDSAKKLFDGVAEFEACPICDTSFLSTPHGSRGEVHAGLSRKLSELAQYREAEKGVTSAKARLEKATSEVKTNLETAIPLLEESGYGVTEASDYLEHIQSWKPQEASPDSSQAIQVLANIQSSICEEITRIEQQQGESTFNKAFETVQELLKIKTALDRIQRTKKQLGRLHQELDRQTLQISSSIVDHVQKLVGQLQDEVRTIYEEIQGTGVDVPPIRIELPEEDDVDQQRAQLVIDYSDNRKDVVPSGYLSDSQIHTLALALRLAAVRQLNPDFPVLVLDDVVTSYDADHRKNIAAVLANRFADFQVLVVTHDEQFFCLLRDQLPESSWQFKRILEVRPGFGPVFHDHQTPDEVIQGKIEANESAGADIRQAEEEWLLRICREFGTKLVIRPIEKAFDYQRSELADSLASFLKDIGLTPPEIPGVSGSFLASLQKGVVENEDSHYSDNPYKAGSPGDDKARWSEFKSFRDLFKCPACEKRRFRRLHPLPKPMCTSCQTPFSFGSTTAGTAQSA